MVSAILGFREDERFVSVEVEGDGVLSSRWDGKQQLLGHDQLCAVWARDQQLDAVVISL